MKNRKFLRLPHVEDRTGVKRSTIYKMIQAGSFPKPIKLSSRCALWPEDEVVAWQERQLDTRNRVSAE